MNKIFIGFDTNEVVAYHVLVNSIIRHAKSPVSITPLILDQLPIDRSYEADQSTQFSFSRYLVPYLCGYRGKALFLDCDMLVRCDINELFTMINHDERVAVVKHDYVPKYESKFLDKTQTAYARKNWTSVMLFNCYLCESLSLDAVNHNSSEWLRNLHWATKIGELDKTYNHLVGEYEANPDAKIVHFTQGTPCFAKYRNCEFSNAWYEEKFALQYYNRMGEYSLPTRIEQ
jgi:lipopolysaccharide biosynthesis glycosyltransferase